MLGVLIAEDSEGRRRPLYAFSGLVGGKSCIDGFVPPIFDSTAPDGHFKQKEAAISALGAQIAEADSASELTQLRQRRKEMSEALQDWLFGQYKVRNALGECQSI